MLKLTLDIMQGCEKTWNAVILQFWLKNLNLRNFEEKSLRNLGLRTKITKNFTS